VRPGVVAFAALLLMACSTETPTASATASPIGTAEPSPLARPSGHLDAQVPMPDGFPSDVPIYTKARLTAGAAFTSSGQVSWGMEWETLDSVDKVRAFYADKLNQGDWTIKFTKTATGTFAATFARKSNAQVQGTLTSNGSSGVTKILMSLVAPT
jgi:hypothetical protein